MPRQCFQNGVQTERFQKLIDAFYGTFSSNNIILTSTQSQCHYRKWVQRWQTQYEEETSPSHFTEALESCDVDIYPSVCALLEIASVLPVSTATVERSFSTLGLLKTYLRNSTSEDRLNGLALLSIYSEMKIDIDSVLNRFGSSKNRRLLLV